MGYILQLNMKCWSLHLTSSVALSLHIPTYHRPTYLHTYIHTHMYMAICTLNPNPKLCTPKGLKPSTYLWLVGNGRMVIVVIVVPHSSIPYEPKVSLSTQSPKGNPQKAPGWHPAEPISTQTLEIT